MDTENSNFYWQCRSLLQEFNFSKASDISKKNMVLKNLFKHLGDSVWIEAPFFCDYGKNISIGDNTFINFNCVFLDAEDITIGKNTLIGPNVQIYAASHPVKASDRVQTDFKGNVSIKVFTKPITIGDNVWIGGSSVILPGVTIGNNVTIGANTVVNIDIPDNVLVVGNPCVIKRTL